MKNWRSRLSVTVPRVAIVCHDLLMVWLCWHGLHWLRYAMVPGAPPLPWWSTESAIVLIAQGIVFWRVGLYRGLWRFASVPDLANIFKAGLIGLLAIAICLVIYNRIDAVSRAALLLYPFGLVGLLGLPRLLYRAWKDHQVADAVDVRAKRVLILGAGRAAEALLRDLRRSGAWEPVGLLDDDEKLQGTKLRGVPVLGKLDDAANIARETAARLVVIAMPSLDASQMQRVVGICENAGLPFRTVPRLVDILEGRSMPGELKEVAIDDLLGRKPVTPDWKLIRGWLGGRTVLVTGAGGSIGSELCRQCARHGAARIALMEISEWALIRSHQALTKAFPDLEVIPFLGNCGDPAAIRRALAIVQPDAVFHAAAYKHVPLLEGQLREAIRNNVLVTETMARACREAKVGTFVFISTDKAVDPANVLGASKRLAEMTCQSLDERGGGTRFTTVRFGNVLDSAGSGGAAVPRADPHRRPGHGDPSGRHPLLHDHSRGLPADRAGRRQRRACLDLHTGHGRADPDPHPGRADDPPGGQAARARYRHHLYRPASRREAARDAVPCRGAVPADRAFEDPRGPRSRRLARGCHAGIATAASSCRRLR